MHLHELWKRLEHLCGDLKRSATRLSLEAFKAFEEFEVFMESEVFKAW